jgi:hypothetical protein
LLANRADTIMGPVGGWKVDRWGRMAVMDDER